MTSDPSESKKKKDPTGTGQPPSVEPSSAGEPAPRPAAPSMLASATVAVTEPAPPIATAIEGLTQVLVERLPASSGVSNPDVQERVDILRGNLFLDPAAVEFREPGTNQTTLAGRR